MSGVVRIIVDYTSDHPLSEEEKSELASKIYDASQEYFDQYGKRVNGVRVDDDKIEIYVENPIPLEALAGFITSAVIPLMVGAGLTYISVKVGGAVADVISEYGIIIVSGTIVIVSLLLTSWLKKKGYL